MVHALSSARLCLSATALIVLALASMRTPASGSLGEGSWREGPAPGRCATTHAAHPDALLGSEDPAALMRALRQHGLAGTDLSLRGRGPTGGSLARATGQGSLRCDTTGPGMVLGGTPLKRSSNRD